LKSEDVRSVGIRVFIGFFFFEVVGGDGWCICSRFFLVGVSVCFPGLGGSRLYLMVFGETGYGIVVYISYLQIILCLSVR
jgi:hypothetical protein